MTSPEVERGVVHQEGFEPSRVRLEGGPPSHRLVHGDVETCRGIEPRTRRFADSADRQIDTSWCARPELNQAVLSGTQACDRYISGAWNGCECPGTIRIRRFGRPQCRQHLTRRELASGFEPVWSIIPRCAPSNGNQRSGGVTG